MASESNTTETQPETQPKTGPLEYKVGDEFSIMRGIHRGKAAKVIHVDEANRQYTVILTDGSGVVVNEVNVKPQTPGTIKATDLAALVTRWTESGGDADALVSLLSENVDGFAKAYDSAE